MEIKSKKRLKILIAGVSILLISVIVLSVVFVQNSIHHSTAKNTNKEDVSYATELQDFDMDFTLTYQSNGETVTINSSDLASTNANVNTHAVIRLTKEEYATLKLVANYTGSGKCYYRFKVTESWQHVENIDGQDVEIITPKQLSVYTLNSSLYDNRSDDGYIYGKEPLKGASKTINVITKFTEGADATNLLDNTAHASQFVDLAFTFEATQWNQAVKVWDLQKLPWE